MSDNQLQVIVKDSGLDATKADVLLEQFKDYFKIAGEWEERAKAISVTDASQKAEMQMARAGRLFLREKRIAIEKSRKALKEQSIREGKAIDGIANVLKALIVPIEKHLEAQEKFVEIKAQEAAEAKRIELEKQAEEDRIAKEKAEKEANDKLAADNLRLNKEAKVAEAKAKKEREAAEAKQREVEEKAAAEKKVAEAKAKKLRAELAAEKAKADAMIECPYCHKKFSLKGDSQ